MLTGERLEKEVEERQMELWDLRNNLQAEKWQLVKRLHQVNEWLTALEGILGSEGS